MSESGKETGFTKSRWFVAQNNNGVANIVQCAEHRVAAVYFNGRPGQPPSKATSEANAALIAAAPSLYEALASCEAWLTSWAQHAGRCADLGGPCTCGLVAMKAEARSALLLASTEGGKNE